MKAEQSIEVTKREYPVLKIHSKGLIVLFTDKNTGTVVDPFKTSYSFGEHALNWNEDQFSIFHGKLVLSNDN